MHLSDGFSSLTSVKESTLVSEDLEPVFIIIATVFAFVALLLVSLSCMCCLRDSPSSSGYYNREEDTVTFADLLSKPPLADPESVFSELSYDGRTSGTHNSWLPQLYDDESGPILEHIPSLQPRHDHDPSRRSLSVKLNNAPQPGSKSPATKKWSSEKQRVNHATRLLREKEKENKFILQQGILHGDKSHLSTVEDLAEKNENIDTAMVTEHKEDSVKPDVELPSAEVKLNVSKLPSIEDSGLKIHQESAKPKSYAFSSTSRCSFSHEVGHIANGSKLPRTSLPRTEENESPKIDPRKLHGAVHSISASDISEDGSGKFSVHKQNQHLNDHQLIKSNSDHVISYRTAGLTQNVDTSDKTEKKEINTNSVVCHPVLVSFEKSEEKHILPLEAYSSVKQNDANFVVDKLENEAVILRRSFSQVQGSGDHRGERQTNAKCFSLNLKINFHFGSDASEGQVSAECITVPISKEHSFYEDDSNFKKLELQAPDRNLLFTNTTINDHDVKEKLLEDSFAAKMSHCKYLEPRKRLSEPYYSVYKEYFQTSRRFSEATTKVKEGTSQKSRLFIHDVSKPSNLHRANTNMSTGNSLQSIAVSEPSPKKLSLENSKEAGEILKACDENDNPETLKGALAAIVPAEKTAKDALGENVKDEATSSDNKAVTRLHRSNVLKENSPPRLKRIPVKTKRKSLDTSQDSTSSAAVSTLNDTLNKTIEASADILDVACRSTAPHRSNDKMEDHNDKRSGKVFPNQGYIPVSKHIDEINQSTEVKKFKPTALPRLKSLPQGKEPSQLTIADPEKNVTQDSKQGEGRKRDSLSNKFESRIPVLIIDDDTGKEKNPLSNQKKGKAEGGEETNVSDESDYDNPWDDLDDAVKRASIRYNRRPSRVALGANTLFLKSAEDLGRLLEEAEKKRKLRQQGEELSPEEDCKESMTIPFTRFSPYRHTVKGIVSPFVGASHSSENIIDRGSAQFSELDTVLHEDMRGRNKKSIDSRRPQSMSAKLKSEIHVPGKKRHKN